MFTSVNGRETRFNCFGAPVLCLEMAPVLMEEPLCDLGTICFFIGLRFRFDHNWCIPWKTGAEFAYVGLECIRNRTIDSILEGETD